MKAIVNIALYLSACAIVLAVLAAVLESGTR